MDYNKDVGGTLLHYIMEQRAKVHRLHTGTIYDKDDPRYEIILRHEADKLHLLESVAIDAGCEMQRTISFGGISDDPKSQITSKEFGSLYFDGNPVDVGAIYDGQELSLGNTVPGKEITWVGVNGMYIADRCICMNISWSQLNVMELVFGKEITIDGRRYLCRLLKVGSASDEPNEWDAALDVTTEDDSVWHWGNLYFWGQETSYAVSYRALRGWNSARDRNNGHVTYQDVNVGFRPTLVPKFF